MARNCKGTFSCEKITFCIYEKNILLLFLALSPAFGNAQEKKSFVVVELFTSEGCSTCPSADLFLSEISRDAAVHKQEVYCLAYHVDYWNKLGWKDPFSKFQFTRRQENYSRILPSHEMYTPQMVVNGTQEYTGTDQSKVQKGIQAALTNQEMTQLELVLDTIRQDTAYISWKISSEDKNTVLQLAFTESGLISKVESGENAGKTLLHNDVVRVFTAVNNPGKTGQTKILLKDRNPSLKAELTGFIQNKQNYKIAGAARISLN